MHECSVPLIFIFSLSPEENAFIQFDKLNPAKGEIAPATKLPNEAKNTIHFLFLYKVNILPLLIPINFFFCFGFGFTITTSSSIFSSSIKLSKEIEDSFSLFFSFSSLLL